MAEFSFPLVTSEKISARILERARQPEIDIPFPESAGRSATVEPQLTIDLAGALKLIAQARRKAAPSGWRYFHRVLRRQPRINDLIFYTLGELTEVLQGLNAPLRKLQEHVERTWQELARLRNALDSIQAKLPGPIDGFDELYLALENEFRGSEEVVRDRLRVYLPYLKELIASAPEKIAVLDLGCGRGEWLGLLQKEGCRVQGVDRNAKMVASCRNRGLNVSQGDLLDYLRNQKNCCFEIVSGFHVIEHLRFDQLVEVLDQTLRILTSDGLVIFETPNPECVLANAQSFYLDPTHNRPLPAKLLELLLKSRGFASTEILKLQPVPPAGQFLSKKVPELASALNAAFLGAQDYGVIARKSL